ncbi:hypothetical protein DPMN_082174 [Dreissena polymorpha]|uniref:Uncharacterized protein n=1 Tax=Dreissena polymorpha TaxID=45954 RepID=A0A9D4BIJ3_DREPO|nr:hypothetical protein DPMN_082174 [Dreissena polymorpha]
MPQKPNTKNSNNNFGTVARFPRASPSDATQMGDTGVVPNHGNIQINRLSIDSGTEQNYPGYQISTHHSRGAVTEMPPRPHTVPDRLSSPRPRCERSGRSKSRSRAPMGRRAFVPYPQDWTHPVSHLHRRLDSSETSAIQPWQDMTARSSRTMRGTLLRTY